MSTALTGIAGLGVANTETSSNSNSVLEQTDFLELLMIQLQNQDPMSPLDSQEFAAQLAQFSQLEQLTQMNENLDSSTQTNLILAQSVNNTMAASMIGKDVVAYGNQVELSDGNDATINYQLDSSAQKVTIEIKNQNGATVRTIEAGPQGSGDQEVNWDGLDNQGDALSDGIYTFSVTAETNAGTSVNATTYTCGTISGVSYTDGMAEFMVGSMQISLSDIYQIIEL